MSQVLGLLSLVIQILSQCKIDQRNEKAFPVFKIYSISKVQNVSFQFGHDIYGRAIIHN